MYVWWVHVRVVMQGQSMYASSTCPSLACVWAQAVANTCINSLCMPCSRHTRGVIPTEFTNLKLHDYTTTVEQIKQGNLNYDICSLPSPSSQC